MTDKTQELLPCPFCGEQPRIGGQSARCDGMLYATCGECGIAGNFTWWNTRSPTPTSAESVTVEELTQNLSIGSLGRIAHKGDEFFHITQKLREGIEYLADKYPNGLKITKEKT